MPVNGDLKRLFLTSQQYRRTAGSVDLLRKRVCLRNIIEIPLRPMRYDGKKLVSRDYIVTHSNHPTMMFQPLGLLFGGLTCDKREHFISP